MMWFGHSIVHRLLAWFVASGVVLIGIFGAAQLWVAQRQIHQEMEQLASHAVDGAVAYFEKVHLVPLEGDLRILERLSGLDELLQSWGEEALLHRPKVERQFQHIQAAQKEVVLSIRFFDQYGQEKVAVTANKRVRDYWNLFEEGNADALKQHHVRLFEQLRHAQEGEIHYLAPFQMADGRWTLLAGIPKMDPVIGVFAGVLMVHCDLADYIAHIVGLSVAGYHEARLAYQLGTEQVAIMGGVISDESSALQQLVSEEVILGHGEPTLKLRIAFLITPDMMQHAIRKEMRFVITPILFLLVLMTGISYLVSKRLAAPIIALRRGMTAIGQGNFDTTLAVTTRDEIGDLAVVFNRMVQDLQVKTHELERSSAEAARANETKGLFLANMSHEIRTPMNAIIGLTDLALQSDLSAKSRDHLNKIASSSRSLLRIINDILDFSKIDAGRMELEKIDFLLRDLFDRLADLFRLQVAEKRIELIFDIAAECRVGLHGDPLRLEQILMNLISNAIKFTEPGGEVVVRVEQQERPLSEGIEFHFLVRDTGIGIAEAHAVRLFQPFNQADLSTTRMHGGTGLGLAISKRLVELMEGRIWLESVPNQGSTFHFTARFSHYCRTETEVDLMPPPDFQHLPVLLVAAHPRQREVLRAMLQLFTCDVVALPALPEAVRCAQQKRMEAAPFRLAVIDGVSRDVDLLRQLRGGTGTDACRIMWLLAPDRSETPLPTEVDWQLTKPVNCSMLFDGIMELFGLEMVKVQRSVTAQMDLAGYRHHLAGARVLLVEDNAINRQVAEENLVSVGLVVEMAENGLEAIQKVQTRQYDLVLMDIQMPKLDGYAATRAIRADGRFRALPILAMTAHAMDEDRQASLDAGMNGHLSKPIDRKKLFETLIQWIGVRPFQIADEPKVPAVAGVEPSVTVLPGIEREPLLELINYKYTLLRALLLEFQRNYGHAAETLRSQLIGRRQGDLEEAKRLVHSLKGSSGNLSAMALYEAARELESAMRADLRSEWPVRLDRLEVELQTVMLAIEQWLSELESGQTGLDSGTLPEASTSVAPEPSDRLLVELDDLLAHQDFSSQECCDRVRAALPEVIGLDAVAEAIEHLDFVQARLRLRAVAHGLAVNLGTADGSGSVQPSIP
ncbi:MAG: response regulator [Magnetococcales bacterium]|nr:response regulator [Magnetococcales bacterium]NGZ07530.1 response regulator [Magnetococcales bacterium]